MEMTAENQWPAEMMLLITVEEDTDYARGALLWKTMSKGSITLQVDLEIALVGKATSESWKLDCKTVRTSWLSTTDIL